MAERSEIDCQMPHPDWKTVYYSGYSSMKELCSEKNLDSLINTAQMASTRFIIELAIFDYSLDVDYAASAAGHLHYFYERMLEKHEEDLNGKPISSQDISNPNFDFTVTQTYLTWRLLEVYLSVAYFPLSKKEQYEAANSIENMLSSTYNLIDQNITKLPVAFRFVQDDMHDFARGKIRNILNKPDYYPNIPYFRSQKRPR